jgi:hypothetical protein
VLHDFLEITERTIKLIGKEVNRIIFILELYYILSGKKSGYFLPQTQKKPKSSIKKI